MQQHLDHAYSCADFPPVPAANDVGRHPGWGHQEIDTPWPARVAGREERAQPAPLGPDGDSVDWLSIDPDFNVLDGTRWQCAAQGDFDQPRAFVYKEGG